MKTLFESYQESCQDIMKPGNCCLCGVALQDNEVIKIWYKKEKPAHAECIDNWNYMSYLTSKDLVRYVGKITDTAVLHNLYSIETQNEDRLTVLRAINNRLEKLQRDERGNPK